MNTLYYDNLNILREYITNQSVTKMAIEGKSG